jgi:SAM-dependent methyltransferase
MQTENELDQYFWNSRWENNQTGWDIGQASPAIAAYMGQYANKQAAILIPGCGNAHEVDYLLSQGFNNMTLIDIAPKAVALLKEKYDNNPAVKVILGDFFEQQGNYDLIIEQTFFCAISPSLREKYVQQAKALLADEGRIIGVLFNITFEKPGPPFGGSAEAYQDLFKSDFIIHKMEPCYNSITPRAYTELFIHLIKK